MDLLPDTRPLPEEEVFNRRMASELHTAVELDSLLGRFLDDFRSLRADLHFEADYVHAVVTIERQPPRR